jgi:arylsulfatase A-like enzyme
LRGLLRQALEAFLWLGCALIAESVYCAVTARTAFVAGFEVVTLFNQALPLAAGFAAAIAFLGALLRHVSDLLSLRQRGWPGLSAVAFSVWTAFCMYGAASGRRLVRWQLPIGLMLGTCSLLLLFYLGKQRRPRFAALIAIALAGAFWGLDAFALPRLYPPLHLWWASASVLLVAWASLAPSLESRERERSATAVSNRLAIFFGAVLLVPIGLVPLLARKLARFENLRLILSERAPLVGRAVRYAGWFAPTDESAPSDGAAGRAAPQGPSLDLIGADVLLISIDALRADHLGAYGYARKTSPNIDKLAQAGALFRSAYCPTPHTSYSVTSMMTGKYMRPLVSLDLGGDSPTCAEYLRKYEYRTAAFYPPAVFFIDESSFAAFRDKQLGFEYAKVEFAPQALRVAQVEEYLKQVGPAGEGKPPIFTWVHLFEPHEPYVPHPEHDFGGAALDRYDSEVAEADATVGRIVAAFDRTRSGKRLTIITADHGEEFGEHGGAYHGTTVYEEQVRVPLIVSGAGIPAGKQIADVVQTVDLLPTVLSGLQVPVQPRLRGKDRGALLLGQVQAPKDGSAAEPTWAFAETEQAMLLAEGSDRLVCQKQIGACALYDLSKDPLEKRSVGGESTERFWALKKRLSALHASHGRYEGAGGAGLPEALRRGRAGDRDAALDVSALLDDVKVEIRRNAATVLFRLRAPETYAAVLRCAKQETDRQAQATCAAASVRLASDSEAKSLQDAAAGYLAEASLAVRLPIAMSLAEREDRRAEPALLAIWASERAELDYEETHGLLHAVGKLKAKSLVPVLIASLESVRYRRAIVETLGKIGDARAQMPLLDRLPTEPYPPVRTAIFGALMDLGADKPTLEEALAYEARRREPVAELGALLLRSRVVTKVPESKRLRYAKADGLCLAGERSGRLYANVDGTERAVVDEAHLHFAHVWAVPCPMPPKP